MNLRPLGVRHLGGPFSGGYNSTAFELLRMGLFWYRHWSIPPAGTGAIAASLAILPLPYHTPLYKTFLRYYLQRGMPAGERAWRGGGRLSARRCLALLSDMAGDGHTPLLTSVGSIYANTAYSCAVCARFLIPENSRSAFLSHLPSWFPSRLSYRLRQRSYSHWATLATPAKAHQVARWRAGGGLAGAKIPLRMLTQRWNDRRGVPRQRMLLMA